MGEYVIDKVGGRLGSGEGRDKTGEKVGGKRKRGALRGRYFSLREQRGEKQ